MPDLTYSLSRDAAAALIGRALADATALTPGYAAFRFDRRIVAAASDPLPGGTWVVRRLVSDPSWPASDGGTWTVETPDLPETSYATARDAVRALCAPVVIR